MVKSLKDVDLKGKKVVLRAELNVPIENGMVVEDARLRAALKTIDEVMTKKPALLVILAHLGRPEGKRNEEFSLKIPAKRLEELSGIKTNIIESLEGLEDVASNVKSEELFLLENIRFWPEEESGDEQFGKRIGEFFDVYVNDCFSTSHRAHASLAVVPKYAKEKYMGLLFEEEYTRLEKVKNDPNHPAVMVIGGAKIETKLPVIESLKKNYDKILVGGLIANEALDQKLDLGDKVLLPVDFAPRGKEEQRIDIGTGTVESFVREISQAETIVWNGPMGKFEDEDASSGTRAIHEAIAARKGALQVVGGGETLEAIKKFGNFSDFDYVSMSGGAMLDFLAGAPMPGIEALEK